MKLETMARSASESPGSSGRRTEETSQVHCAGLARESMEHHTRNPDNGF